MTRSRLLRWTTALVVLGVAAAFGVSKLPHGPHLDPGCVATVSGTSYALDLSQAANAATIAAVAKHRGLGDHAVTVALATAMQESKLHNLPYGDRDSLGLFQQRPSQGWGTRAQLLDPHYAAGEFFAHLAKVPGWAAMPVADAAQAVQRSAGGYAYADWEPAARLVAQALTGQVPHALSCFYAAPKSSTHGLLAEIARDLGPAAIGTPVADKEGWRTAGWLVAQAAQYSIDSVSFNGQRWARDTGRWHADPRATGVVRYALLHAAS